MRIAIFDYMVAPTNPAGGCHYRMIQGLCREHEFTVFALEFDNPCPERIRWVRVPTPKRPGALAFIAFHVLAPAFYIRDRIRHGTRYDLVQFTETNLSFGNVAYAHFCFRSYLKRQWRQSRPRGLRRPAYWLALRLRSLGEPVIFRRVKHVVVPSKGLARELRAEYPFTAGKIHILPNPVDVERMKPPQDFNREGMRQSLGLSQEDVVLAFVALGAYERKGLPLLLDALAKLSGTRLKLLVVGGPADLQRNYRSLAARMGLEKIVQFIETQRDVRPYLWSADAFVFPSFYEVFPLGVLEAAATGLPLLVTPLSGVEEFLRDGKNGILLERSAEGVVSGLRHFLELSLEERLEMGRGAQRDAARYDTAYYVKAWRQFYREIDGGRHCTREPVKQVSTETAVAGRGE